MPAPGGEVVGAYDRAATLDLAPAADVIGRREIGDRAVLVVGGEPGDAAHFPERAFVEQEVDALAAGELAAAALPNDAGVFGSRRESLVGQGLHRADVAQQGRPGLIVIVRGDALGTFGRRDHGEHLARLDVVARLQRLRGGKRACARRGDLGFHLHRADDEQGIARLHAVAFVGAHLEHGPGHRAGDGLLARGHVEVGSGRRGRRARTADRGHPHDGGLLLQQCQGAVAVVGRSEQGGFLAEERRPRVAGAHGGVLQYGLQLGDVGRQAPDVELVQGPPGPVDGGREHGGLLLPGHRGADDLGQQGIELRRWRVPNIAVRVHAHARPGRFLVSRQGAGAAGDDTGLNGETAWCANGPLVGKPQGFEACAGGDPELRLDQIDAGDFLGDRVFHLDARVALDEVVRAGLGRDQELHRAGIDVAGRFDQLHGIGMDASAQRVV